jgi:hypothetical protein
MAGELPVIDPTPRLFSELGVGGIYSATEDDLAPGDDNRIPRAGQAFVVVKRHSPRLIWIDRGAVIMGRLAGAVKSGMPIKETMWSPENRFLTHKYPPPPPPAPAPLAKRDIPDGSDAVISMAPITEDMKMVDFHDEYDKYKRYWTVDIFDQLPNPKSNPFTFKPISPADLTYYIAHIVPAPAGAGRRRRRTSRRFRVRRRNTRRYR